MLDIVRLAVHYANDIVIGVGGGGAPASSCHPMPCSGYAPADETW